MPTDSLIRTRTMEKAVHIKIISFYSFRLSDWAVDFAFDRRCSVSWISWTGSGHLAVIICHLRRMCIVSLIVWLGFSIALLLLFILIQFALRLPKCHTWTRCFHSLLIRIQMHNTMAEAKRAYYLRYSPHTEQYFRSVFRVHRRCKRTSFNEHKLPHKHVLIEDIDVALQWLLTEPICEWSSTTTHKLWREIPYFVLLSSLFLFLRRIIISNVTVWARQPLFT